MDISTVRPWPVYSQAAADELAGLATAGTVYDYAGAGPVDQFEREFSALHGGRHAVSFNSGTSALFAALCALGVRAGDEVIVPNLTFLASASPALWLGAVPVLVDSCVAEPSVSPRSVRQALTPRTKAVVVTHLFGNPVDVSAVAAVCSEHRVALVEDCSHAHASDVAGAHVGTFGDAAIYSIGAGKVISGGHGGVMITADEAVRDLALLIGHFKPRTRTDVRTEDLRRYAEFALGGNLRLSPMAAVLAMDHLCSLDAISRARCHNVDVLDDHLAGLLEPVRSPEPRHNRTHFDVVYRLPEEVPTEARDALVGRLQRAHVPVTPPATRPLNRVLRAIPPEPAVDNDLVRRLASTAAAAPPDEALPHSTSAHDRMISFPARLLHHRDAEVAHELGRRAHRVLAEVVGGRT
ncbi:DegT/DnrJ/EryC1/StrS family aminotransferase [Actinotalea solisilvae]|uniref:DegT/DnrJ/EryC1/StrS family aminotransferase n=1 Tax=Actinotalea solisilvae TaxID=2072922 RepID=UPI0018F24CE1|nr:DegT/DnrJ/EryC1/StrS family aminotransferase [Actinotalea solisilvae]